MYRRFLSMLLAAGDLSCAFMFALLIAEIIQTQSICQ